MIAFVAVPVPSLGPLSYRVPDGVAPVRGARVVVPLGGRVVTGCVLRVCDDTCAPAAKQAAAGERDGPHVATELALRDLIDVVDDDPLLPADVLALAEWLAGYYVCSVGEALSVVLPPFAWAESRPSLRATDAGRARAAGTLAAMRLHDWLLERVVRADVVARTALASDAVRARRGQRVGRGEVEACLRELERGGLVERVHALTGARAGFRTVRHVTLTARDADALADASRTPRQRHALEVLSAAPAGLTVPDLAAAGVSEDVVRRLEARGVVRVTRERVDRDPFDLSDADAAVALREAGKAAVVATADQEAALGRLIELAGAGEFRVALLHGVTGSGKTEVYRRLAVHVRDAGRRVLILVPEIALTPAVAATFRHTFGDRVAIQHSALSDGERHDQWHRIRRGDVDVVVGTRSAVFAPLSGIGLVVVDEEHDTSYKQEDVPRYNGRDVAIVRARGAAALVVLGSATPSLETYHNALAGRYERIVLSRRVLERPLADVRIVDMREEYAASGPDVVLSGALRDALARRGEVGEQAIVLLNRRGYASAVFCRRCAAALDCPNCSVSLTLHRAARRARCHYCDFSRPVPERCDTCGGEYLDYLGIGTERVEAEVSAALPAARVVRVDRDTIRRRGEISRVLRRFASGDIDVLVGTQMLAKGHDFPAVTLVGVISADVGLGLADFRAAERTFQLLTQVAGRAGRGDRRGEAVIQTLYPRHYSIRHARAQDYEAFFEDEMQYRRAMRYPPVLSLVNVIIRGRSGREALGDADLLARDVRARAGSAVRVLGPAPAPLQRLRGEHRAQVFLKSTNRRAMREAVTGALAARPALQRRVTIDVDPLTVL